MWVLHMLIFLLRKMSVTPRGQSQRSGNLVSETSYSSIHSTNTWVPSRHSVLIWGLRREEETQHPEITALRYARMANDGDPTESQCLPSWRLRSGLEHTLVPSFHRLLFASNWLNAMKEKYPTWGDSKPGGDSRWCDRDCGIAGVAKRNANWPEGVSEKRANGTLGRIFQEPAEERFDKEGVGQESWGRCNHSFLAQVTVSICKQPGWGVGGGKQGMTWNARTRAKGAGEPTWERTKLSVLAHTHFSH